MRMPFGKHRDEDIDDVPDAYLRWVLANVNDLDWPLRQAIVRRLDDRARPTGRPTSSTGPGGSGPSDARRSIEAIRDALRSAYRDLATRFHPDHRGGSNEAMTSLNLFYERLDEALARQLREFGGR